MSVLAAGTCGEQNVSLQVLGSGGPEISDGRASSGYLIWQHGKARILVDMGGGSLLRFEESGAQLNDLELILLTHLHVDHSADLPYLVKASYFSGRNRDLPVFGPTGNWLMPATTEYVNRLIGPEGAFRYLADYLDGTESYRLVPHDVKASGKLQQTIVDSKELKVVAVPVHHGPVPALAWRVSLLGLTIVFSGDMNNSNNVLAGLAKDADLLVAHHAIPEEASAEARSLHMPPSVIGRIAGRAGVKRLLLSHRMKRTVGHEAQSTRLIAEFYHGQLEYAEDLQCVGLP